MTEVSERITRLKERKAALLTEIAETKAEAESLKPLLTCLRCGFAWRARSLEHPPNYCSRCHSAGWNRPPKAKNSRHPSDPKNPRWEAPVPVPAAAHHPLTHAEANKIFNDAIVPGTIQEVLTGLPPLPFVPDPLPPPMLVDVVGSADVAPVEEVELEEPSDPFPPEPVPEPDPDPEPESETPDAD